MQLAILSTAAFGLATTFAYVGAPGAASRAEGPDALVGSPLYGSEAPIARWGDVVTAEELSLEDLGRVAAVTTSPDGTPTGLVVSVGGIWGYGARSVELGMDRVHLVADAAGGERLVVDLSAQGGEPETL